MSAELPEADRLHELINDSRPFGPIDTDTLIQADYPGLAQFFDRKNLVYTQSTHHPRYNYIVGRKGAGKTAFLAAEQICGAACMTETLRTASLYAEMLATLNSYAEHRGTHLFVDDVADLWRSLLDHVALAHVCRTATVRDPAEIQEIWDYLDLRGADIPSAETVAEDFLGEVQRRIREPERIGIRNVLVGYEAERQRFESVRHSLEKVLEARSSRMLIVMDNLEELHARMDELREVLAGLFACAGRLSEQASTGRYYQLRVCLPTEFLASIMSLSSNPEKDFRDNYLTIYWTAKELLHLAGRRLRLYLETQHPEQLSSLMRTHPEILPGSEQCEVALLRATLPPVVVGDLGVEEDPVAYILRHTQLLPRHILQILNGVYSSRGESLPWRVAPDAVLAGTHDVEERINRGILTAHPDSQWVGVVLTKLANRLEITFQARQLHKYFNQQGIKKATGRDFSECVAQLSRMGILGLHTERTARYCEGEFQYTTDATLPIHEESSELCVHPLFSRLLYSASFDRLRDQSALPVYPRGSDPLSADYRGTLGYDLI
ncbi:MAG: P-loop ATPase, Sll1717 family [Actinomycetales bacterium]